MDDRRPQRSPPPPALDTPPSQRGRHGQAGGAGAGYSSGQRGLTLAGATSSSMPLSPVLAGALAVVSASHALARSRGGITPTSAAAAAALLTSPLAQQQHAYSRGSSPLASHAVKPTLLLSPPSQGGYGAALGGVSATTSAGSAGGAGTYADAPPSHGPVAGQGWDGAAGADLGTFAPESAAVPESPPQARPAAVSSSSSLDLAPEDAEIASLLALPPEVLAAEYVQRQLRALLDMREMRLEMARLETQRRLERMRIEVQR